MVTSKRQNENILPLPTITQIPQPTVADQVFDALRRRILSLELPPSTKISEAEVARQMGVSRQPVREAFKRLAKLGFLMIRPQSGTTISLISEDAVMRARFIRKALEGKTCRRACRTITDSGRDTLAALIEVQQAAVAKGDRAAFHDADDAFHREICVIAGVEYVWDLLEETKAHMDRIRMLSLDSTSQQIALQEHIDLFDAIISNNPDEAERVLNQHLSRILFLIADLKAKDHNYFTEATT
ncbi:transcriptional regulator, GntR family [Sulfitobacter marinus]|uniref:Transcriptional regulator, GntR family n=1 Tax=Sulfitobacter marinus TaxID=394264 RepID=A0A1I6PR32_9RHOB|nr:GntR family transcriptional regulator [Sulfitobacter marinus]SFS42646.1 transcriptional regulator, GntR family [Sulfitobacter marinus]